jgi:hypothetical protein
MNRDDHGGAHAAAPHGERVVDPAGPERPLTRWRYR